MRGFLCACVALSLCALGNAQRTTDTPVNDRNVPARGGNEGPLRYEVKRIDWRTARDAQPMTPTQSGPAPANFSNRAVSYDARTGVETYRELPNTVRAPMGFVSGSEQRSALPELNKAFGAPSTITSTSFPWSAQVRLFYAQTGGNFVCSGTMVDAQTVMTAGHCVHEGSGGNWSTGMTVSPSWDGDDDAYGSSNGIHLHSYTGWTDNGDFDHDMGYIHLDRPIGFLTSWLGYGYNTSNSFYTSTTFHHAAYPGCSNWCAPSYAGCPNQMWYMFGPFDSTTANRLTANFASGNHTGGMSGGGAYYINSGTRYVHGVNSTRSTNACAVVSNTFCRMTQSKFDDLGQSVIPGGYPATLDLVPLDVNSDATARAGQRLNSFDYLVGNASMVDPASASYGLDVYLSTNDNISAGDTLLGTRSFTWDFSARGKVRITSSSSLPLIPSDTTPGPYWLGVILQIVDANTLNNDTDDWDAHPITILRKFPDLPSGTLWVGSSGKVIDFESMGPYVRANHLNSETMATSTTAWVNWGNSAQCISPFRGNHNLELGNDPSVVSVTPDNISALIVKLNGQNGLSLVMDFMLADWGEEADPCDGVWISQDGDRWYSLTPSGWSSLYPSGAAAGLWYSVRDVALTGATSVNTDLDFYLAFVAQDNFPFAGADGIGIDDIRIHPPNNFTFTVSNLAVNATGPQLHMHGGAPFAVGHIWLSGAGGGPVNLPLVGTLLLTPPIATLPGLSLDASGSRTVRLNPLPQAFQKLPLWWHAIELTMPPALRTSNGLDLIIK